MAGRNIVLKSSQFYIKPSNPDDLWQSPWEIFTKNDNSKMGWVSFEGEKYSGTIPISIELEKLYRNRGIGTSVIQMMTDWAFLHSNIYEVETNAAPENDAYIFALEKAGYVFRGHGEKEDRYSKEKQPTSWMGLYVLLGLCVGMGLGIMLSIQWAGLALGLVIGVIFGTYMDKKAISEREKVTGKKIKEKHEKSKLGKGAKDQGEDNQ